MSIALATGLALGLGVLYEVMAPPRYSSSAELLVDAAGFRILGADPAAPGQTHGLALPRGVLEAAVQQAHLADNALFGAPPGAAATGDDRAAERALAALVAAVEVVRGVRASTVDIVVTSRDAYVSADAANAVARAFVARAQAGVGMDPPTGARAEALRQEVAQAEAELAAFRSRNNIPAAGLLGAQQLSALSYQLALARARTADLQAKVAQIDQTNRAKLDTGTLPEAIQSPVIAALRSQYARLAQQEASMSTELGAKHPALIQIQEQMREARGLILAEVERIAQGTRADLARAKANEAALQKSLDQESPAGGPDAAVLARLHELERSAEAKRALYQTLAGAPPAGTAQPAPGPSGTRILAEAVPSLETGSPPLALVLGGALFLGLGAGTGFGAFRDRAQSRITTRAGLAAATGGLPILAIYRDGRPAEAAADAEGAISLLSRLCPPETGSRVRLVALVGLRHDPLRAAMLDELAETASQEGFRLKRVVCDAPTAPSARSRLRTRDVASIVELMQGAGGPPTVRRLRQSLIGFGSDSDIVLLDTPPLLDAGMPPALIQAADAVVLVVAPGDLDRQAIETLCAHVESSAMPAVGIILDGEIDLR